MKNVVKDFSLPEGIKLLSLFRLDIDLDMDLDMDMDMDILWHPGYITKFHTTNNSTKTVYNYILNSEMILVFHSFCYLCVGCCRCNN